MPYPRYRVWLRRIGRPGEWHRKHDFVSRGHAEAWIADWCSHDEDRDGVALPEGVMPRGGKDNGQA